MSTASDFWTGTFSLVATQTAMTTAFAAPFSFDRLQLFSADEDPEDFDTDPNTSLFSTSTSPLAQQASGAIASISAPSASPQTLTLAVMGLPGGASLVSAVLTQTSITTWTATFIVARTGNDPGTRTYSIAATKLTPTPNLQQDFGDGVGVAVGAVNSGRIIYNDTTVQMEVSLDGAAYVALTTGPAAGFGPTGVLFADAVGKITDDVADFFYVAATGKLTARSYRMANVAATTADVYLEFDDGQTVPVSNAGEGRMRYNAATSSFEVSENAGAWTDLTVGGTAFVQNGNSFGALAVLGTNDVFGLSLETSGAVRLAIAATGPATFTQAVATTGSVTLHTLTPAAHTTLTGESPSLVISTAVQQWNSGSGAQALTRAVIINAPTYDMDGAATFTLAITMDITGPPIAGTGGAMVTQYGLRVNNTASAAVALTTAAGALITTPQSTGTGSIRDPRAIIAGSTATIAFTNGATFNYSAINVPAHTVTVSNTAMTLATSTISAAHFGIVTVSSTQNTTNAATVYIAGAPAAAGGGAITNAYSLWVDAGNIRADGVIYGSDGTNAAPTYSFLNYTSTGMYVASGPELYVTAGGTAIARWTSAGYIMLSGALYNDTYNSLSATNTITYGSHKTISFAQTAQSTGTHNAVLITGAVNTGSTPTVFKITGGACTTNVLSTEATDVLWDLSRTVEFATGALAVQRQVVFDVQTTIGFVGASTLSNAIGLHITAGPTQGANATFTNVYGVLIGNTAAAATATTTMASAAATTFIQVNITPDILSLTGTTNLTTVPSVASLALGGMTVNTTGAGLTLTAVTSLYINSAPSAGANVTFTDKYAVFVDSGIARFDGDGTHVFQCPTAAAVLPVVTRTIAFKDGATTYYIMCSTAA